MEFRRIYGLEILEDRASIMATNAEKYRGDFKERPTLRTAESKGYAEGRNGGLREAHEIMQHELKRLMNKFQNGSLSVEDFGVSP